MIRWMVAMAACLILGGGAARADVAGSHDYYVLALSWQPTWCAIEGDARDAPICATDVGWRLHGLWPQYETGWPDWCAAVTRDATRAETAAMADIMPSAGLAWYQWRKHGRCSGLAPDAYFAAARAAWDKVARPAALGSEEVAVRIAPGAVTAAFLDANPELSAGMVTVSCRDGRIAEVRVCLTRDLVPRRCGGDVARACGSGDAIFTQPG